MRRPVDTNGIRVMEGTDKIVSRRGSSYLRFNMSQGDELFRVSISIKKLKVIAARAAQNKTHRSNGGPVAVMHAAHEV